MSASQRICYLHIGTRKTSTTSIQAALAEHRSLLEAEGVWYPPGLSSNQRELTFAAGGADKMVEYHPILGAAFEKSAKTAHDEVTKVLEFWLARSDFPAIVFSAEDLSKLDRAHIVHLRGMFEAKGVEVRVICYLRDQFDYLLSNITTIARNGGRLNSPESAFNVRECEYYRLDYQKLLEDWSEVFGRNALRVGLYEDAGDGRGIVARFMEQLGVNGELLRGREPRENAALGPEAIAFLLSMNQVGFGLDPLGGKSAPRWKLEQLVEAVSVRSGGRAQVNSEVLGGFNLRFAESNEWVRENFFPERPPNSLFADKPAARASGSAIPSRLDGAWSEFFRELLDGMFAEMRASEGKAEYLWGRVNLSEKQPREALAGFDRALEYLPTWHVVHYYRAHALYQLGRFADSQEAIAQARMLDVAGELNYENLISKIEHNLGGRGMAR